MSILDAYGTRKQNDAMQDTWGHMYTEPGSKHYGEMTIAVGAYGELVIVNTDFKGLSDSPMRHTLEHTIFDLYDFEVGVYVISCGIWFYKICNDMYLGDKIGKLIKTKIVKVLA